MRSSCLHVPHIGSTDQTDSGSDDTPTTSINRVIIYLLWSDYVVFSVGNQFDFCHYHRFGRPKVLMNDLIIDWLFVVGQSLERKSKQQTCRTGGE